jgi:hypothetical protein
MRGIRDSVVERYSEQAHFVYELLQNADDVLATKVRFVLQKDGFYFIHNGQIPFTVTPPNDEKAGHINAITSIGASSKKDENYKIGKFGIGFKSVFQYTQTPYVYDENVAFRIRDLIVPELLDESSHPMREKGETLFYFPFNHEKKTAEIAHNEIQSRLEVLRFPLLFLNNLVDISWETDLTNGFYRLEIEPQLVPKPREKGQKTQKDFTKDVVFLKSIKQVGNKKRETNFVKLLGIEESSNLTYSVVFQLDSKGEIDTRQMYSAHCFFPTRVQTPFRFLIHAPFLLTDSREGIKFENVWNKRLIDLLANLIFDKINILKENNLITASFFKALPLQEKSGSGDMKTFFQPFFQAAYQFFRTTNLQILPCACPEISVGNDRFNNDFTDFEHGFLSESQALISLFDNTAIEYLTAEVSGQAKVKKAKWIFSQGEITETVEHFVRKIAIERANLEGRISPILTWEKVVKYLDTNFLEQQNEEWLLAFYAAVGKMESLRILLQKTCPIIRLENGKMVTAFDAETGKPNAYLPTNLDTNYPTIKQSIAENAKTFFEKLGLTTPELRAELTQFILPKYKKRKRIIPKVEDLEKLFLHYQNCNAEEGDAFCQELSELPILQAIKAESGEIIGALPSEIYLLNADLETFFEGNDTIFWLALDDLYGTILERLDVAKLRKFLLKIGVNILPKFVKSDDTLSESERKSLIRQHKPEASFVMWEEVEDISLEGLQHFLMEMTVEKYHFLWSFLNTIFNKKLPQTTAIFKFEYEDEHSMEIETHWLRLLRSTAWILDKNGFLITPEKVEMQFLNTIYPNVENSFLKEILFKKTPTQERLQVLTADERAAMELGQRLLQQGLTVTDLQQFQKWRKTQQPKVEQPKKEIKKRKKKEQQDTDEFNPAFLSSEELIEKKVELRQKMEAELAEQLDVLEQIEVLKNIILEGQKYSFIWFKALLELEYILALEQIGKDRSFRINFKTIEQEAGTSKTILLKSPNKNLPISIETMGDMTLKIQLADERRSLAVEVVSIKDFSLRAKLKSPEEIEGIDFQQISGGILEIQNTIFTLEALVNEFKELDFEDTDSLQECLTPNINFVFGPPGTGKTTHLATQEILPMMEGEQAMRILVLTPTNKSADVLARKILSLFSEPPFWLLRFGASGDNVVENAGLLCDKTLEINDYERCCVITTATRFPYDGFDNGSQNSQLKNIDWDVIIIDEASMIMLPMMAFILHQSPETQFIIAGDPFQIEPIVFAEEWKGENIYSLVNLNSFDENVQKNSIVPHQYLIKNLTIQYRSIPSLGHVFSNFAYENRLAHFRKKATQRVLKLDNLELKSINIIRFPVNKLETLYRSQRLKGSHFHIYSALLTAELVKYLVIQIYKNHIQNDKKAKPWRIGIICPYKAQAQMVDKILAAQHVFKPKVSVTCGTIHSFQGDECDVMINLYNPPLYISKSPNMFLNRTNILNVGISRAKDYLFLLIPDKETDKVWNLEEIGRLLNIIRHDLKGEYWEKSGSEIEQILFDSPNYLEQNTFATTHQSINVYTEPEKQFEIRVEEMAVDVQVGKK